MAKRFIDPDIFPKGWRKVEPTLKLAFYYFWTRCDKAGVWEIDEDLFEFDLSFPFPVDSELQILQDLGLIERNNEIILLCDYSIIDNGRLGTSNAHKPAYRSIEKYGLFYNSSSYKISLFNLNPTLKEPSMKVLEKEKEKEGEKEKEKGGLGEISQVSFLETELFKLMVKYFSLSETRNPQDLMNLNSFLFKMQKTGRINEFQNQFEAYCNYKEQSNEASQSFNTFIGVGLNDYDAGWLRRNWVEALKSVKPQTTDTVNGKTFRELARSGS